MFPTIQPGKRVTAAGRTGSGKTTWARWMLLRSPLHWIILNPKHTAGYATLPGIEVINGIDLKKITKSIEKNKFTLVNPGIGQTTSEVLDLFVEWLHNNYSNIGLCCDELYTLHANGQAGPGLIGWLTRGRELNQSFLGLTQRPVRVSLFCFSEADYLCEMVLTLKKDRQRFFEFTGRKESLMRLLPRKWLWYVVDSDTLTSYGEVPLK